MSGTSERGTGWQEPTARPRRPWLTGLAFALTLAMALAQLIHPPLLVSLQRTPAAMHGEWWRVVTALMVQDGGLLGAASNLLFLAGIGVAAEQVLTRARWLVQYVGVGVAIEFVAHLWQPVGGGNSIAVCGLTGAIALVARRRESALPPWSFQFVAVWCGALLATEWLPLIVLGFVGAGVMRARHAAGRSNGLPILLTVAATGIALAVVANIHGAALLLGLAVARAWPAGRTDAARSRRR